MNPLIGIILILASSIGHAEWWIQLVNRSHAFRIDHRKLRQVRRLHDVAVLIYPLWLVQAAGTGENGLLNGGVLTDLPAYLRWILAITSLGLIPLIGGMIRWQLRHRALFHAADSTEICDLHSMARSELISGDVPGPRKSAFRKVPGNQILQLEINSKSLHFGRTFQRADTISSPLQIVHLSDLHFCGSPGEGYYRWALARAADLKPDAFVFTGDLIDDPKLIPIALDCLKSLVSVAPCYFILGNHDWRHDYESLRSALSDTGWNDLGGQSCVHEIAGRRVLLSGCEYPWIGPQPLSAHDVDCDLRILLSHSPDQFRAAIRAGYDVMLSGHTHGGQVVLPIVGPVYSPSLYGVRFAAGLFQVGGMGIHVSRGMGAKDCLRLRCRPELTSIRIMGTGS